MSEQELHTLSGLAVEHRRLRTAFRLPGLDRFAEDGVYRLGERRPGLVDGNIEQTDSVVGQDVVGVAWGRCCVVLVGLENSMQCPDLCSSRADR
jgi:hypothetical protein